MGSILPGMRLRIPEGRLQYDFVKMDMVENTLRPDLDYLYGDIHLEDPSIKLVTAVGMKAKIDLLPFSAAIDAAGFGQTARVATRWVSRIITHRRRRLVTHRRRRLVTNAFRISSNSNGS